MEKELEPVEYIVRIFEGPMKYEYEYRTEDQAIGHYNMEMDNSNGTAFVSVHAYYWNGTRHWEERIR